MSKIGDLLKSRKPRRKTIRLVFDGPGTVELERLRLELRNRKLKEKLSGKSETLGSELPALERRIQELEASIISNASEFTFEAIGRRRLQEFKEAHPPSAAQWLEYKELVEANPYNPPNPPKFDDKAIMVPLIAESAVDPAMTLEEAEELWDTLSDGEAAQIQEAVWTVNQEAATVPLSGSGIGGTAPFGDNSITQLVAESRGASITDES